jgi:hypothetical protein
MPKPKELPARESGLKKNYEISNQITHQMKTVEYK